MWRIPKALVELQNPANRSFPDPLREEAEKPVREIGKKTYRGYEAEQERLLRPLPNRFR